MYVKLFKLKYHSYKNDHKIPATENVILTSIETIFVI